MYGFPMAPSACDDEDDDIVSPDELQINDIVSCKLHERTLVTKGERVYDDKISLKIIGAKESVYGTKEYVVYIPSYDSSRIHVAGVVSKRMCLDFGIPFKFMLENMTYIRITHVCSFDWRSDGMQCVNCEEYVDKAAPNMDDGTFACYSCRQNPWR